MKKRNTILRSIFCILMIISLLPFAALTANAETGEITVDGIKYKYDTDNKTASVVGYEDIGEVISIPSSITVNGTDCSVTSIGDNAFNYCTSLTSVTIPDSVTSIGDNAFYECTSLASVTIPDSVTSIGNGAFQFCFSLASVTIPSSVTSIGKEAFNDCNSLTEIRVAEDNPSYTSEDGVLFSKDKKTLITWPDGKRSDSYTVPSTVTNIMSRAFDYHSPSVITIPSSVKNIDNDAFCFGKTKTLIMESKDISIGNFAFEASDLTSLYFTGTKEEWSGVSKGDRWCLSSGLGNDPAVKQITFKVVNGSWDDGTTADKVITVVGNNADKLIEDVIPAVGDEPNENYAAGLWDNDPLAATLTGDTVFTYKYAKQTTKVTVNKYDITGKEELDGAILTIKDSDGKTLTGTPWTSLKGKKLVVELKNGTYTLTETGDTVTDEDGNEYEIIDSTLTFSVENGRLTVVDNSTSSNSGDGFYDVDSDTNSIAVNDVMKTQEATITWKQDDGTVIDTTSVKYGQSPTHKDPTKQKDNQYIYTFTGWSDGTNTYGKNDTLPEVTGDATYTAVYSQRSYMGSVKFIAVAEDDRIKSQTVVIKVFDSATEGTNYTSYGAISVSGTGEFNTTMTHIPEGDYTYSVEPGNTDTYVSPRTGTFSITGEETTEVKFNLVIPVNSYQVKFVNDDEDHTILQSGDIEEGQSPVYNENTPTKQADAHYSYSFAGWNDGTNTYGKDDTLPEVTGAATYTAVYVSSVNSYTITWKQDDGTLIDTTSVEYGETPTHADPTKEPDEQYTYTFVGWDSKITPVTGEATYTATYTATLRSYTITWQHDDGTEIDTTTVEYGQTPTHSDPKKEATAEFTYTFTGWDPEISSVKGETAYKATYSATTNEYTIVFKNEDGTVLQTVTVAYGETPEYTGEIPTKAEDAENTYIFAGWNQDISAVTGETEYTATFTATQKASPDTGDSSLEIWAIAMVASFACLAMIPVYGRKRAKEK